MMEEKRRGGQYDVIVIGAGLSGLTAAYHLQQRLPGAEVLVLEAKDRIGGRTMTVEMQGAHGPDSWDLGGQWVSSSQHHVMWLLQELGMEAYPQFNSGKKLLKAGKEFGITEHLDDIPSLPLLSLLDIHRFLSNMDRLAKEVPHDEPWKSPLAEDLDNQTLEQLVDSWTWTAVAKETIETGLQVVNGLRLREQSALAYLAYVSSAGSNSRLVETAKNCAQELRVKSGSQTMSSQLADRIGLPNILLSEPVTAIDQSQADKVLVQTMSGKTFSCRRVIVAAPPNCTGSIQFRPTPPLKRLKLLTHMHVGHLFKFVATYKKAFWREEGFSGEVVCNDNLSSVAGCDKGPLQYVLDATTDTGSPALVGFIANPLQWGQVEFEVRKAAILNQLEEFFGPAAKKPIDFIEKDWALEQYNGGCPVSMMVPGALKYWDSIRTVHDRIHWAGTETASQWTGYLSGAVQSGLRAADEVTNELQPGGQDTEEQQSLLADLDAKRLAEQESTAEGSLLWTLGKLAVVAAVVGVAMRRAWLAGGRVNLPWL